MSKRWAELGGIFILTTALILAVQHLHHVPAEAPLVRDLYGSAEAPFVRDQHGSVAAVMRCAHCALVTSSGQLLGSGAGHRIDRDHECVIRMNDAPTAGYERDVGTRTALRVMAHMGVGRFAALSSASPLEGRRVPTNVALLGLSESCVRASGFDALYQKEMGGDGASQKFMTTGFLAMVMAIESCDRVTVYGMVPPDHCATEAGRDAPYHYYEPHGPGECEFYLQHEADLPGMHHRFIAEKQVFARWAQTYNITFAHPAWPKVSGPS